jgi:hypothetical protein
LLPALSRAKARAQLTRCASNVRQIGIASSMYVADYSVYPTYLEWFPQTNGSTGSWTEKLQPYLASPRVSEVYQCPGNPLRFPGSAVVGVQFGGAWSYDMNATGASRGVAPSYGLNSREPASWGESRYLGCKEAAVVSPSQMIAYGDAVPGSWYNGSGITSPQSCVLVFSPEGTVGPRHCGAAAYNGAKASG